MNPIDVVISWVDGYDPVYQQKLGDFCLSQGIEQHQAVEPTRVLQCNEIHYCLHGLRRFAPWVRHIYIVTNQQTPAAVTAWQGTAFGHKIKIVNQNDLLLAEGVTAPIFNSISVEWLIWRIPGLSEQFLYFNDDFFIIRPVTPDDFFKNGRLLLRGEWKVQAAKQWLYRVKKYIFEHLGYPVKLKTNPHRAWQEKVATLAGFERTFYLLPHAPFPLRKQTFEQYVASHEALFSENIRFPFRHPAQVSSIPLMSHIEIQQDRVVYARNHRAIMVNGACHAFKKIKSRLKQAQKNSKISFVCMQSLDEAPPATRAYLLSWLKTQIEVEEA